MIDESDSNKNKMNICTMVVTTNKKGLQQQHLSLLLLYHLPTLVGLIRSLFLIQMFVISRHIKETSSKDSIVFTKVCVVLR